jgi:hypothetical protein
MLDSHPRHTERHRKAKLRTIRRRIRCTRHIHIRHIRSHGGHDETPLPAQPTGML